ncbi:MAG: hypothetical protein HQM04_10735 [Magnetococcales bacterium]|nr:hypothetical protein [Magnetococcales bacterium]MBF0115500.1 hypothetical protein [Magnetococcales bacterium]
MVIPVWTKERTTWHDPKRGFFTLPPATTGRLVSLGELSIRDQRIFSKILQRSPDLVLINLAGMVCALSRKKLLGVDEMVDATKLEQAAMAATLPPLGEYVGSIGMNRPLSEYSREEVMTLVEVVITAYQHYISTHDDIPF